eukprot:CAMPEP_0184377768 /NCGR_PEP_ID=MMETSP0007-20130409/2540_1 /TAXON_ID=97485 /ORGANISM="Prymnesium parvum, Strain Texoma1" /LENGTH=104 /DNA_ID=CAMNT_0026721791 /DNA_START=75 /DNA_END=389 /DNA_ORIENTATION=+
MDINDKMDRTLGDSPSSKLEKHPHALPNSRLTPPQPTPAPKTEMHRNLHGWASGHKAQAHPAFGVPSADEPGQPRAGLRRRAPGRACDAPSPAPQLSQFSVETD